MFPDHPPEEKALNTEAVKIPNGFLANAENNAGIEAQLCVVLRFFAANGLTFRQPCEIEFPLEVPSC